MVSLRREMKSFVLMKELPLKNLSTFKMEILVYVQMNKRFSLMMKSFLLMKELALKKL